MGKKLIWIALLATIQASGIEIPSELAQKYLGTHPVVSPERPLRNGTPGNIDNAIDPDRYFIGMGDAFEISVMDMPSISYSAEVNQNCDIFISDFGILPLGKASLKAAKDSIASYMKTKIKGKGGVYVAFVTGKTATVSVTGAVANPGTYTLPGTTRLSDAIRRANNDSLPGFSDRDFRAVTVANGTAAATFDLFRFFFKGDLAQNPYVYPGDVIILKKLSRSVSIYGALEEFSGTVSFVDGESLADLLNLFTLDASADSNHIILQRGATEGGRSMTEIKFSDAASVKLQNRDVISVIARKDYPMVRSVSISGAVRCQGGFPIIKGVTSAKDVIDMAGGLTESANAGKIAIVRFEKSSTARLKKTNPSGQALPIVDMSLVRPEISSGLNRMNAMNDYIVLNLDKLGTDVKLNEGDKIVVPEKDPHVYISGDVKIPGAYSYAEGKGAGYYVRLAGGFTNKADHTNMFVVSLYDDAMQIKDVSDITEGDILVIPDSEQAKVLRNILIPVIQAAATTVTAIVAVISLMKL